MSTPAPRSPSVPWREGDEWINPVTRFAIRVEESATSTGGARVRWLATYPPYTPPPPGHFHPQQTERFVIVSGQVRARIGESERDLLPGTELEISPRQVHQMWNPFAEPAAVRWETTPALRAERSRCPRSLPGASTICCSSPKSSHTTLHASHVSMTTFPGP